MRLDIDCPCCEHEWEQKFDSHFPLAESFACPACGRVLEIDGDYVGEDSWAFWPVAVPKEA